MNRWFIHYQLFGCHLQLLSFDFATLIAKNSKLLSICQLLYYESRSVTASSRRRPSFSAFDFAKRTLAFYQAGHINFAALVCNRPGFRPCLHVFGAGCESNRCLFSKFQIDGGLKFVLNSVANESKD